MVGWLRKITVIRKIHFIASILIFAFSFFYIVSGFILSHHHIFPLGEVNKTTEVQALNFIPDTANPGKFAQDLKQQFDVSGRVEFHKNKRGDYNFNISRPGINYQMHVESSLQSVNIVTNERKTFGEINKRIHRTHSYQGGFLYVLWAFLVDLTAMSMIVFAVTGFIIWYHSKRHRLAGWLILIPVIIHTLYVFIYLRF